MLTKVKYLLKFVVLGGLMSVICFCDVNSIPPEKRKVNDRIKIRNNIYTYECDYACSKCLLKTSLKGQVFPNAKELSEEYQSFLTQKCEVDRTRIYWTVCPKMSSCTYSYRWDWWTMSGDWSGTTCYQRNIWGDILASINAYADDRRLCAYYFSPVQWLAPACSGVFDKEYDERIIDGWGVGPNIIVDGSCGGGYSEKDFGGYDRDWVEFHPTNHSVDTYGFDMWRYLDSDSKAEADFREENTSYVSLKDGKSSTFISIGLSFDSDMFDYFEARIINNGPNVLSFCKDYIDTRSLLNPGKIKTVQIFGHNAGTAEIEVWGVNTERRDREACINKRGGRTIDRLIVKVYKEVDLGTVNVFRVGNVRASTHRSDWERRFNGVLKQMVAKVERVNVELSKTGWDQNGNGRLDFIVGLGANYNSEEAFNREYPARMRWTSEGWLLAHVNGVYQNDITVRGHAMFIVPDKIRSHCVVTRDYIKSDNILYLNNGCDIVFEDSIYTISEYFDPLDRGERIKISKRDLEGQGTVRDFPVRFQKVDANNNPISNNVLDKEYLTNRNTTIYIDGIDVGYAVVNENISFVEDGADLNVYLHELLHHEKSKRYPHVQYTQNSEQKLYFNKLYRDNIMKPTAPLGGDLRYRDLKINGVNNRYSQWERVR